MNTKPNDFFSDDLSDLLAGDDAPAAPRALPQDDQFARIRQQGTGLAPAAPTFKINCQKCGGSGRFRSYSGRDCGPCFKCEGKGSFERKTSPVQLEKAKTYRDALPGRRWDAFQAAQPAMATWLIKTLARGEALPEGFRNTLSSIKSAIDRYGFDGLTEGRVAVLERGVARDAAYVAAKAVNSAPESVQAAPALDVSKIVEAFQRGRRAGLVQVKLRFQGITLQQARFDTTGNTLLVKSGADKIGKIEAGRFVAFRICTPEQTAQVVAICADPAAAAQAYGFATNSCCVCGRELTNKESVETGIGPICSGRMGWTPGGLKVSAPDF